MQLSAGTQLGPYEILSPIGAGGMGEVYRARDLRLNREVAIKVLTPGFAADEERLRRFRLEAQSAGGLNHPNIVVVHDIGAHEKAPYLVTELLEGESLRERLNRGPLPVSKTIEYTRQIAAGLAAAHAKGITHRDIKPENLFLMKDGRVKILDFGLAKVASITRGSEDSATMQALTEPGLVVGTASYMSPEQVRGLPVDPRSDIFSLGCVLYEMVSGRRAFRGASTVETMSAILTEEPPDITTAAGPPPGLERTIRHCLEKDPEDRFQSARDLAFDLDTITHLSGRASALTVGVTKRTRAATSAPPPQLPVWKNWFLWTTVALALFSAALAYLVFRPKPQPEYHRLTFRRGSIHAARFAPDGHTIVYSARWENDPYGIFTITDNGPESRPLGLAGTGLFGVSSKGELAVGLHLRAGNSFVEEGTLARIPLGGGAPREVMDNVRFADWSPDGSELAVLRPTVKGDQIEYPIGKIIYQGPSGGYISEMRVSPDGARIAFLEHPTVSSGGYVAVVDRAGAMKKLTPDYDGNAMGLAWSPKGDEVWFTAARTGARNDLYAVSLSGRLRLVASDVVSLILQDIGKDGRVLLTEMKDYRSRIMFRGPGDDHDRDLSWLDYSMPRSLSRDGKQLAFDESGDGAGDQPPVYVRPTDGSPAIKLGFGRLPALAPDGRSVLALDPGNSGITIFPVGVGQPRHLGVKGYVLSSVQATPGGKDLVVFASEKGHGSRGYLLSVDGGVPRPFTAEGVTRVGGGLSPDGKWVGGFEAASGRTVLYPLDGGAPEPEPGILPGDRIASWNTDGSALYVYHTGEFPLRLVKVERKTGRREELREISPADQAGSDGASGIILTPDAKSYAYSLTQQLADLVVVSGYR